MSKSTKQLRQFRIRRQLAHLPEKQLKLIEEIIGAANKASASSAPLKLEGIWKNKGFEQIENLEQALKETRQELEDTIAGRAL